jgi:hypothetical protein
LSPEVIFDDNWNKIKIKRKLIDIWILNNWDIFWIPINGWYIEYYTKNQNGDFIFVWNYIDNNNYKFY